MVRAFLTGRLTSLPCDLAMFSSQYSKRLCIFDLHGTIYSLIFGSDLLFFSQLSLVGLVSDLVD